MNGVLKHLFAENPMTLERTRGWRKFFQVGQEGASFLNRAIIGLLGAVYLWLLFLVWHYKEDMGLGIVMLELGFLTLLIPGSLYGSISGEREKLTWDALIMTRLTPGQILAGKFFARLPMILGIMLICSLPLVLSHYVVLRRTTVEFTMSELLRVQASVFGWSVFLAGFSLMVSAKTKRSITSLSIVVVFLLSFLILVPSICGIFLPQVGGYEMGEIRKHNRYWGARRNLLFGTGTTLMDANPFLTVIDRQKDPEEKPINFAGRYADHALTGQTAHRLLSRTWHVQEMLPLLYLVLGGLCFGSALGTLRGLEPPNQRPEPKRSRPLDPDAVPEQG